MRQPGQPLARQRVDAPGRDLRAELLQALRVGATEDAVVERLEGDAFLGELALDVLVAVDAELGVIGKARKDLRRNGPKSSSVA